MKIVLKMFLKIWANFAQMPKISKTITNLMMPKAVLFSSHCDA